MHSQNPHLKDLTEDMNHALSNHVAGTNQLHQVKEIKLSIFTGPQKTEIYKNLVGFELS